MAETAAPSVPATPGALDAFERWTHLIGRGQQLMLEHWSKQQMNGATAAAADPLGLVAMWSKVAQAAAADPAKLVEAQARFWADSLKLWTAMLGGKPDESPVAAVRDKRFADKAWTEMPAFDLIRQSYLLAAQHVMTMTGELDGLSDAERTKALFHTRQFVDAMSPSNFALTNPQVLAATVESGGENLIKGLEHMLDDLSRGRMKMVDESAFEVGVNVAATPGKVIYENRLFQLLQYAPTTETVFATPLLIYPPWINKFYILDLTPEKSFIRWAVSEGFTVFVVSWKSADATLADATLDTYVGEGQLMALAKTLEATGADSAHTIGYCVAGTTLAATLAYLHAKGEERRVATATFFTAQVDFSEPGDLKVFIDEPALESIARCSGDKGYLDGRYIASTFNLLRSNDLVWNYVVNNYMLGKDYLPFDLLYWNGDATNVPARWHDAYLRDMYRDNKLMTPGGISVAGTPIDLSLVRTPSYIQGGREDHIAPAPSAYKLVHAFKGPVRFVLAGSGHIAGVVNPPSAMKYQHWINEAHPASFDAFVAGAVETKGSWWPDWLAWLAPRSGERVPARVPGEGPLKAIEDAPGRYVRERI